MKNGPHILVCSDFGTGKSTFASTIIQKRNPRPVLIHAFDTADKLMPYRKRGITVHEDWQYGRRDLIQSEGRTLAVIEYWIENDGVTPSITLRGGQRVITSKFTQPGRMYERYLERMKTFLEEIDEYYAFILDSTTALELSVRTYLGGVLQVGDNQLLYNQTTNELERFMCRIMPNLPITCIAISHDKSQWVGSGDDRHETGKRLIRLPGRLSSDPYGAFGEVYAAFSTLQRGEDKQVSEQFLLQTRRTKERYAASQLDVPNPMEPHIKHVFAAMKASGVEIE